MTTDGIINIILAVAVPGLMALIGGVLAARTLPSSSGKRIPEVYIWSSLLVLLFLVSVVLAFIQQVRSSDQQRSAERAATVEKLEASGTAKYTQGELDSINKVLTALVQSKPTGTGDDYKNTLRALLQVSSKTPPMGPPGLRGLSNSELKAQALAMASSIRGIEQQSEAEQGALMGQWPSDSTKTQVENDQLRQRWTATELSLFMNEQARWAPLSAQCALLIDEMRSRVPAEALPKDQSVLSIIHIATEQGSLAGAYPLRTVSDYVERLALLLPQPKPKRQ